MMTSDHYIRKVIGLGLFQNSVLIFYIALSKVGDGVLPIYMCANTEVCAQTFSSPLPHVLMLTAIVVGFATMSVALALILQIKKAYNSSLESEVSQLIECEESE